MDVVYEELVKEWEKAEKEQLDNICLVRIVRASSAQDHAQNNNALTARKMLKKSHAVLIAGGDLTDNFNPVTGRRLFNFAGMLHLLALTGGMQDIKQEHCRRIRDWIRYADQHKGED